MQKHGNMQHNCGPAMRSHIAMCEEALPWWALVVVGSRLCYKYICFSKNFHYGRGRATLGMRCSHLIIQG